MRLSQKIKEDNFHATAQRRKEYKIDFQVLRLCVKTVFFDLPRQPHLLLYCK